MLRTAISLSLLMLTSYSQPVLAQQGSDDDDGNHPSWKINPNLPVEGNVIFAGLVEFADDSENIIYIADQTKNHDTRIYKTSLLTPTDENGEPVEREYLQIDIPERNQIVEYFHDDENDYLYLLLDEENGSAYTMMRAEFVTEDEVDDYEPWVYELPEPENQDSSEEEEDATGYAIENFFILKDRQEIIIRATQDRETEPIMIWKAGLDEQEFQPLSPKPILNGNVAPGIQISPDERYLVYLADQEQDEVFELYSMEIATGQSKKLNKPMEYGQTVLQQSNRILPDLNAVIYLSNQDNREKNELFIAQLSGGEIEKINPELPEFGDIMADGMIYSSARRELVYFSDRRENLLLDMYAYSFNTRSERLIWEAPEEKTISPANIRLSPAEDSLLVNIRREVTLTEEEEEESREAYENAEPDPRFQTEQYFHREIYHIDLASGEKTLISPEFPPENEDGDPLNGTAMIGNFTPDGNGVIYVAKMHNEVERRLYYRSFDSQESELLTLFEETVDTFRFVNDGEILLYKGRRFVPDQTDTEFLKKKLETQQQREERIANGENPVEEPLTREEQEDKYWEYYNRYSDLYAMTWEDKIPVMVTPQTTDDGGTLLVEVSPDKKTMIYTSQLTSDENFEINLYGVPVSYISTRTDEVLAELEEMAK